METLKHDLSDVRVRLTYGELHGVPVVHEVHELNRGGRRSHWYVDGSWAAKLDPHLRHAALRLPRTGGEAFERGVHELAYQARP